MLASKFSGRWDESLEKTPEGRFFIDQSIDLFLPLIDYLRGVALVPHARLVRPPNPPCCLTWRLDHFEKRFCLLFLLTPIDRFGGH